MKISYNWLKEFVNIKTNPQKLAEDLSLFGHEIESIEEVNKDYIMDLEITPNRGDCLSVLGIAREIAAMYNTKLKYDFYKNNPEELLAPGKISDKEFEIEWSGPGICLSYQAALVEDIKIEKSPKWLQDRLELVDIRPINNIVDITNYMMIETGQPFHAFDYDKISHKIRETKNIKEKTPPEEKFSRIKVALINIRTSKKGEGLITLDNKRRILEDEMIIIEDNKKIYDLVGIMGGANSEVDKNTKTIILQAAVFDPKKIRRTSKKLGLITEASYRYERGVDVGGSYWALLRALDLLKRVSPEASIICLASAFDNEYKAENKIKMDSKAINKLLGTAISTQEMIKYLSRLGFQTKQLGNYLTAQPPSYRLYDVKIWPDLAEEIARVYGYNKIKAVLPTKIKTQQNKEFIKKEALKDLLVEHGFTEVYSYSFVDKNLIQKLGNDLEGCRRVINGLSPETEYLRPNLIPSLLTAIAKNPWAPEIQIFEMGQVFTQEKEHEELGLAVVGRSDQAIRNVLDQLKIKAEIKSVEQKILDYLKIRRPVKYVLINLSKKLLNSLRVPYQSLWQSVKISHQYRPISTFAPTVRDLAFIVDKKIDPEKVRQNIADLDPQILLVELFDEFYFDQKELRGLKNLAYHIWLQDLKGPMKEKEVKKIINKIIKTIEQKFKAKLRR